MTPAFWRRLTVAGGLAVVPTACAASTTTTSAQVQVVLVDKDVATDVTGLRDLNWGDPRYFIGHNGPDSTDHEHPAEAHAHADHGTELAHAMAVVLSDNASSPAIEIKRYVVSDGGDPAVDDVLAALDVLNSEVTEDDRIVVNLSVGSLGPMPVDVIEAVRDLTGVAVVVVAAGNQGRYLSGSGQTICEAVQATVCVGALDEHGRAADGTSRGPAVDVAAHGAVEMGDDPTLAPGGTTSSAAAVVSALIAELWAEHPNDSPPEIGRRFCDLATPTEAEARCGAAFVS